MSARIARVNKAVIIFKGCRLGIVAVEDSVNEFSTGYF